ncbi:Glycosyltransferase, catalytic subunit of cellulose synthase and poly-beta-1,6-N-acetylglucosamine synthase [Cyclobacterium lianum]|uniref:Glycosyltransferase, catalytic subunit of cellulose synthase and poly-beta-1,6-N-acetylglucosamine synthase n=1 Tax=Cyclobacterium lianum TaxID=388280 RepID=A0A1M7QKR8_9BACT|nr:cellulose synthase family protein [Cyclobacterium lianum]SHN31469.1 Glycosyltransferase, catalytic subunit of cellulose synthase and poly-beta-1,6-N-acetylglucosamine synthase [Cyclobacterium lianum]
MWMYLFLGLYGLAMCFILFYSLAQAGLLWHFFRFKRNCMAPAKVSDAGLPAVTIQLPVFNEKYVVKRLITAVSEMKYPAQKLEIQVLDDSTDETSSIIQECIQNYPDINFKYLHRKNRNGFKAGALRDGLRQASGDLVAIFDADFVPDDQFLLQMVPHFSNPEIGMVQSRWGHLNEDYSLFTRLQAFALDAHFMVEQMGRNAQQAFINFNGTGGIWRKACILDAGNWQDDTLTEDLDLSYRAQQKGWKFLYRPDVVSPAELPPVMSAIKSQQFRWTKGGAECAVKHLKSVLLGSFPTKVKIHAAAHLLNSTIFIAVLLLSLSSIPVWWGFYQGLIPAIYFKAAALFLLSFTVIAAVYFFANLSLANYSAKGLLRYLWELPVFLSVSMGLSVHNAQAVWEGLSGRKSPFIRTPKYNLDEKTGPWVSNVYHQLKVPAGTYFEAILAAVFLILVGLSLYTATYEMLLFHGMLAIGFGMVSLASFRSYLAKPGA